MVDKGYNIENGEIIIQGRGNCCSKLKKGKLRTKNLLKITILDEQEPRYNQQTEQKQCKSEVEEICIQQNLETSHRSDICI